MSFEQLSETMGSMLKALSLDAAAAADDKKIKDAAGEEGKTGEGAGADADDATGAAGEGGDAGAGEGEGEGGEDGGKEKGTPMAKSFSLTLDDGTAMEAFDGTEMLKALTLHLEESDAKAEATHEQMLKAMNVAVDLLSGQAAALKEQGALVKSLQAEVVALAKTGRGRVSTVSLAEKPGLDTTLAKALPVTMEPHEILAKAQSAHKLGRISGLEASGIETRINMGMAIDPALISRISSN